MDFSSPPKASELRSWARSQGFVQVSFADAKEVSPEIWVDDEGRWRLKIKRPVRRAGLHKDSYRDRFSCREINPKTGYLEYYNPSIGAFGTRNSMGHLQIEID